MKKFAVTILGATGSVGGSLLQVLGQSTDRFDVFALSAQRDVQRMLSLCLEYVPSYAVMESRAAALELEQALHNAGSGVKVLAGAAELCALAEHAETDVVLIAIVGIAGLEPALAAARAGKRILLANKESVVAGGKLLLRTVREGGAELLPVDSEHSAIFQCFGGRRPPPDLQRVILTASGGPLRTWSAEQLMTVTPQQACAHPVWKMGAKISVDSATLMNKGLEWIEAWHLFSLQPEQVQILIHPQSIVHALVEFVDGSMLAQMASPDMRLPLAAALAWPERMDCGVQGLDLAAVGRLDFSAPCLQRFPCLRLALAAGRAGGGHCIVLNAANEVAVQAFLSGEIRFTEIATVIESGLAAAPGGEPGSVAEIKEIDREARHRAMRELRRHA